MVACGSNEHFNSGFDIGVILELVMYIFIELTAAVARFGTKARYACLFFNHQWLCLTEPRNAPQKLLHG